MMQSLYLQRITKKYAAKGYEKTKPKQTQFPKSQKMNVNLYVIKDYENETTFRPQKNKPKQTQFKKSQNEPKRFLSVATMNYTTRISYMSSCKTISDLIEYRAEVMEKSFLRLLSSDQGIHKLVPMYQYHLTKAGLTKVLAVFIESVGPAPFGTDKHVDCEQSPAFGAGVGWVHDHVAYDHSAAVLQGLVNLGKERTVLLSGVLVANCPKPGYIRAIRQVIGIEIARYKGHSVSKSNLGETLLGHRYNGW